MRIGLSMFPTEYAIEPHQLAKEAEARGFESLWFPEHTHIPASRRTPYPGGTDLPMEYWHTFDPFGALCAAAVMTSTLKLATGICAWAARHRGRDVPHAMDRAIEYGDGWMPIDRGGPEVLGPMIAEFDRRVAASGRSRRRITLTIFGAPQKAEALSRYEQLGVDRAVLIVRPEPREVLLPKLD